MVVFKVGSDADKKKLIVEPVKVTPLNITFHKEPQPQPVVGRRKLEHFYNFTFIFLTGAHKHNIGTFEVKELKKQRWLDLVLTEFDH